MLLSDIRKNIKLEAKRHPMFEKNRFGKFYLYFMILFWIGYLIFFGITFALGFRKSVPHLEPYHVLNQGLIIILLIDFIFRFFFRKPPVQEIKPYLLLPVKKNSVLNALLLNSGLSTYNLLWLCMFLPFALLTITRFYGIPGTITYCTGIWMLMVMNNYWYLLCRSLINEKIYALSLPLAFYSLLLASQLLFKNSISNFSMELAEGFIEGKLFSFLLVVCLILLLLSLNRYVMKVTLYSEIAKVKDHKVKKVSEYRFLEKYGETGEYIRLELKLLFRNKRCKSLLRMMATIILFFSLMITFTPHYDGSFLKNFITIYNFAGVGIVILILLMSFEGNYLDGLMARKESILSLLEAKYYFYCFVLLIPFACLIPAMVMGKITLLAAVAYLFLTTGPVYCLLFQMAVYNKKTVPLNEGLTGRQSSGTGFQSIVSSLAFAIPLILNSTLTGIWGDIPGQVALLVIGVGFTLASPYWIRNVYRRFMKRRYENMEGFRDTK